jgi:hypothetical protein
MGICRRPASPAPPPHRSVASEVSWRFRADVSLLKRVATPGNHEASQDFDGHHSEHTGFRNPAHIPMLLAAKGSSQIPCGSARSKCKTCGVTQAPSAAGRWASHECVNSDGCFRFPDSRSKNRGRFPVALQILQLGVKYIRKQLSDWGVILFCRSVPPKSLRSRKAGHNERHGSSKKIAPSQSLDSKSIYCS